MTGLFYDILGRKNVIFAVPSLSITKQRETKIMGKRQDEYLK